MAETVTKGGRQRHGDWGNAENTLRAEKKNFPISHFYAILYAAALAFNVARVAVVVGVLGVVVVQKSGKTYANLCL